MSSLFVLVLLLVLPATGCWGCPDLPEHAWHLRTERDLERFRVTRMEVGWNHFEIRHLNEACKSYGETVEPWKPGRVPVVMHFEAAANQRRRILEDYPERDPLEMGDGLTGQVKELADVSSEELDSAGAHLLVFLGQVETYRAEALVRSWSWMRPGLVHVIVRVQDRSERARRLRLAAGHRADTHRFLLMVDGRADCETEARHVEWEFSQAYENCLPPPTPSFSKGNFDPRIAVVAAAAAVATDDPGFSGPVFWRPSPTGSGSGGDEDEGREQEGVEVLG